MPYPVLLAEGDSYEVASRVHDLNVKTRPADTRKIQGSKTALAILCDQLDLLAAKMDDVRDAVYRRDAQALIQHGQFLEARFATGADLLGPGAPGAPGATP